MIERFRKVCGEKKLKEEIIIEKNAHGQISRNQAKVKLTTKLTST